MLYENQAIDSYTNNKTSNSDWKQLEPDWQQTITAVAQENTRTKKKRKLYYRAYTPVRTPKLLQKIRQISPDIAADNPVDHTTVTNVP